MYPIVAKPIYTEITRPRRQHIENLTLKRFIHNLATGPATILGFGERHANREQDSRGIAPKLCLPKDEMSAPHYFTDFILPTLQKHGYSVLIFEDLDYPEASPFEPATEFERQVVSRLQRGLAPNDPEGNTHLIKVARELGFRIFGSFPNMKQMVRDYPNTWANAISDNIKRSIEREKRADAGTKIVIYGGVNHISNEEMLHLGNLDVGRQIRITYGEQSFQSVSLVVPDVLSREKDFYDGTRDHCLVRRYVRSWRKGIRTTTVIKDKQLTGVDYVVCFPGKFAFFHTGC